MVTQQQEEIIILLSMGGDASRRISEIYENTTRIESQRDQELKEIVPKLASRSYHLEKGSSWCQDWLQYQKNTHPVFSICFHHPLHPIKRFQRVIILIGSIAFGLAITNVVYLGFLKSEEAGTAVNYIYEQAGKLSETLSTHASIEVEQSLLFLWTVGSFLHSMFDLSIWYLTACACFRPGGFFGQRACCQNFGLYFAVLLVVGAVFSATSVVIVRLNAANVEDQSSSTNVLEEAGLETPNTRFSFLLAYALELVFALFVFYFVTSTIFFSGILGCGFIPILGGRPYELRKEAAEAKRTVIGEGEDGFEEQGIEVYNI